jgi:hypothetical protein
MSSRRILLFLGAAWELVRLFAVLSLLVLLFEIAGGRGSAIVPWLLLAATGNLLVPAGAVLLALYPERYARVLGLLRLGKLLNLVTLVLIVVAGVVSQAGPASIPRSAGAGLPGFLAILLVTALDAIFLALLVSFRPGGDGPAKDEHAPAAALPDATETEIKELPSHGHPADR